MDYASDSKLSLTIKTWNKDTEDLYDFETDNIQKTQYIIDSPSQPEYLIKTELEIVKTPYPLQYINDHTSSKIICQINFFPSSLQYELIPAFNSEELKDVPEEKIEYLWLKLPQDYIPISIGDIIKIGRVRIKLSSFSTEVCVTSSSESAVVETNKSFKEESKCEMCRVCYRQDSDIDNPLISPCLCTGTIKYIHYKCLQSSINMKFLVYENDYCKLCTWKNFNCEICKSEYPTYLKYKARTYPLIDYTSVPFHKFAVFDYYLYDDEELKPFRRGTLFVNLGDENKSEFSVGRTQSNAIKLRNISVSRVHCSLKYENGMMFIRDDGSKFGTMLYMKEPYIFCGGRLRNLTNSVFCGDNCVVSSGRYAFEFSLEKKKSFFLIGNWFGLNCCKNQDTNDSDCLVLKSESDDEGKEKDVTKKFERKNVYEDHIKLIDYIFTSIDSDRKKVKNL